MVNFWCTSVFKDKYNKDINKLKKDDEYYDIVRNDKLLKAFFREKTTEDIEKIFKSVKYLNNHVFLTKNNTFFVLDNDKSFLKYKSETFYKDSKRLGPVSEYIVNNAYFPKYTVICDATKPTFDKENILLNMVEPARFTYKGTEKNIDEYKELNKALNKYFLHIGENNKVYKEYYLKWCSNVLHGIPNHVFLFLYSHHQGHGKSIFNEIMAALNGKRSYKFSMKEFAQWNGNLCEKTYCYTEEIDEGDYKNLFENLKSMVGSKTFNYENK